MPRKGPAPKRPLVNDPVYSSPLVTQLVNKVLKDGKRSLAERIVYAALEGAVDDGLGDRTLAVEQHLVHQLGDQRRVIHRVGDERPPGGRSLARH